MRKHAIGQRYRKVSFPAIVWEVVGHRTDLDGIRHVRLVNVADQTRTVLIGEGFLARPDAYIPAPV